MRNLLLDDHHRTIADDGLLRTLDDEILIAFYVYLDEIHVIEPKIIEPMQRVRPSTVNAAFPGTAFVQVNACRPLVIPKRALVQVIGLFPACIALPAHDVALQRLECLDALEILREPCGPYTAMRAHIDRAPCLAAVLNSRLELVFLVANA